MSTQRIVLSARTFLVYGLLAGLLAGLATFAVAHQVGEPHAERAIALEEAATADSGADHETGSATGSGTGSGTGNETGSSHNTEVPRDLQRTWGLLTGSLAMGLALGGIAGLAAAGTMGRLGRMTPAGSTAVVVGVGFVAVALVPFLKYPATPPAVGDGDTIGQRTALFFVLVALSLAVAVAAVVLARRLASTWPTSYAVGAGVLAYVVVLGAVAALLPAVDEVGDFPASTLWSFRLASLLTLATLWGVIGLVLTALVDRAWRAVAHREQLRDLVGTSR